MSAIAELIVYGIQMEQIVCSDAGTLSLHEKRSRTKLEHTICFGRA